MNEDDSYKLHVSLPNHSMIGVESFWAAKVGEDLYRIENVPFYAYGLNFRDVVRAYSDADGILEIQEVVERSGNQTMRVDFNKTCDKERQPKYLEQLKKLNCSFERWNDSMLAINVRKEADFNEIVAQLEAWEEEEILDVETAHQKKEGSFDDVLE